MTNLQIGEWAEVPNSYNLWLLKEGALVTGRTWLRGSWREMSSEELELKLRELESGHQVLAEISQEGDLTEVKIRNRERVQRIGPAEVIFEFSGSTCMRDHSRSIA